MCEVLHTRIRNPKATTVENCLQVALSCRELSQMTPSIRPSQEFLEGNIWIMNAFIPGNAKTAPPGALKRCPGETACVKAAISTWNARTEAPHGAEPGQPSHCWWPFPTSCPLGVPRPQVLLPACVGTPRIEPSLHVRDRLLSLALPFKGLGGCSSLPHALNVSGEAPSAQGP